MRVKYLILKVSYTLIRLFDRFCTHLTEFILLLVDYAQGFLQLS